MPWVQCVTTSTFIQMWPRKVIQSNRSHFWSRNQNYRLSTSFHIKYHPLGSWHVPRPSVAERDIKTHDMVHGGVKIRSHVSVRTYHQITCHLRTEESNCDCFAIPEPPSSRTMLYRSYYHLDTPFFFSLVSLSRSLSSVWRTCDMKNQMRLQSPCREFVRPLFGKPVHERFAPVNRGSYQYNFFCILRNRKWWVIVVARRANPVSTWSWNFDVFQLRRPLLHFALLI